jgi:membrane protease YdiL (CAAX protease family)
LSSLDSVWPDWDAEGQAFLVDPLIELAWYLACAILLWLMSVRAGVNRLFHIGELPTRAELRRHVVLSLPPMLVSVAGAYVLYLPLSCVIPDFVSEWLLTVPPSLEWDEPGANAVSIGLSTISLFVVAPIVEEVTFRGFLFNRWWNKYLLRLTITFSSVVFALVHADIVGSFVFAMILCLLFIKTGHLLGQIIVQRPVTMLLRSSFFVLDGFSMVRLKIPVSKSVNYSGGLACWD